MKVVCIRITNYENEVFTVRETLTLKKIYEVLDPSLTISDGYGYPSNSYLIRDDNGRLYFAIKENFVPLREVNLNKLI